MLEIEIKIDADACKKDGLCVMTCPRGILRQEEKNTVPEIVDLESCFRCGQCAAICRQGALSHSDYPKDAISPVRSEYLPNYDQVLELIRSRRSIRVFKEKTLERDVIGKMLEAARFAPSGHNEQSTEFVVVQDEAILHQIAKLTSEYFVRFVRQLRNPITRTFLRLLVGRRELQTAVEYAPELGSLATELNHGTDYILRKAPVLLLFCADRARGTFAGVNANLALHNAALAAETVGIGCFYAGFVVMACERDNSIARLLSLPDTHRIYGALAMGYSRVKFTKWPERKPARVTWV